MKIDNVVTNEHSLVLNEGVFSFDVRLDGCVHITREWSKGDLDYLHICELDEFIKMLEEAKAKAIEHFEQWPE